MSTTNPLAKPNQTAEKPSATTPPPLNPVTETVKETIKETIRNCIQKLLRVTLTDGRTIEGTLYCYDDHANMVLIDATDITAKGKRPFGRTVRLGAVLVPGGVSEKVLVWREARTRHVAVSEVHGNIRVDGKPTDIGKGATAVGAQGDVQIVAEGLGGISVETG